MGTSRTCVNQRSFCDFHFLLQFFHSLCCSRSVSHPHPPHLCSIVFFFLIPVKFNAPSIQPSNLSKLNGILTLKWPLPSDRLKSAMMTEVRMKPRRYGNWTLVSC